MKDKFMVKYIINSSIVNHENCDLVTWTRISKTDVFIIYLLDLTWLLIKFIFI